MKDTGFVLSDEQRTRLIVGHDFGGEALPKVPTGDVIVGSGGIYSTANDLLKWMKWHLDRFSPDDAEARTLDHALYLNRDGLKTVSGMDESGHMDAMGLGWVGMIAKDVPSSCKRRAGSGAPSPILRSRPRVTRRCSSPSTSSISARPWPWGSSPTACWSSSPRAHQAAWEAASSVSTA